MSMDSKFDQPYASVMKAIGVIARSDEEVRERLHNIATIVIRESVQKEVVRHDESCVCELCWAVAVLDSMKEE